MQVAANFIILADDTLAVEGKIEEIKNVDGIGDKTFESLKSLITID